MIVGIGLDVVHVSRLERWQQIPGLLDRYFHPEELKTALSRGSGSTLSLAARFAAKEAFGKAVGTGLCGITQEYSTSRSPATISARRKWYSAPAPSWSPAATTSDRSRCR